MKSPINNHALTPDPETLPGATEEKSASDGFIYHSYIRRDAVTGEVLGLLFEVIHPED
ncbi:hypothetical protein [Pararhizobium sp. O133]|uniref:hypothetical protein n=1 Tax=Pararhizobium sp. O133 TaxID=3449278 RepID=UPI003F687E4E